MLLRRQKWPLIKIEDQPPSLDRALLEYPDQNTIYRRAWTGRKIKKELAGGKRERERERERKEIGKGNECKQEWKMTFFRKREWERVGVFLGIEKREAIFFGSFDQPVVFVYEVIVSHVNARRGK